MLGPSEFDKNSVLVCKGIVHLVGARERVPLLLLLVVVRGVPPRDLHLSSQEIGEGTVNSD